MRRSYGFKQESYVVHEDGGWNYPSYEEHQFVSSPSIYKMLDKPSFHSQPLNHHDATRFNDSRRIIHHDDGTRGWCRTVPMNNNLTLKKNEHYALGSNTILRPPLGSVKPPPSHQERGHHEMFNGRQQVVVNQNGWDYGGDHADDGYEELEPFIKGLHGGRDGRLVKVIEVIQYERTYSGGGGPLKWKVLGGSGSSNNNSDNHFMTRYPKDGMLYG